MCDHGAARQRRKDVTTQDVAEGVAFLCSEAGRFVTGCVLPYQFARYVAGPPLRGAEEEHRFLTLWVSQAGRP